MARIRNLKLIISRSAQRKNMGEIDKQFPVTFDRRGNTVVVELNYPPYETDPETPDKLKYVEIDMCHVRAADGIRISYDFGRDGWKIEQATVFVWSIDKNDGNGPKSICCDNPDCQDSHWIEVAFVQAWGSQRISADDV